MKLNFTKSDIEFVFNVKTGKKFESVDFSEWISDTLCKDWLTLSAECDKRGELVGMLEETIRGYMGDWQCVEESYLPEQFVESKHALSAVEAWRKEQG